MANRFVSAGAIDATTGENAPEASSAAPPRPAGDTVKNDQWETVQKEIEAERRRREEARKAAAQGGEKSLYEVLQANKAAKQAAFEEASKFKNQFRALDDDEIDFLDDVKQSAREAEERVRKETEEGLRAFREARKESGGDVGQDEDEDVPEGWTVTARRKRRREKESLVKGVKRRATSEDDVKGKKEGTQDGDKGTGGDALVEGNGKEGPNSVKSAPVKMAPQAVTTQTVTKPKTGLVEYGSSDEDD